MLAFELQSLSLAGRIWLGYAAIFVAVAAMSCAANATDRTEHFKPSTSSNSSSNSSAYAPSSSDLSMYVLPSVALGSGSLSSGLCQSSWYRHRAYLFGIYAAADGESKPDMECMGLVYRLGELKATPVPKAPVAIMTQPACPSPKPVKTAKKVCQ